MAIGNGITEMKHIFMQDNINQRNEAGEKHGLWMDYWDNNQLWYKGTFKNDKRHGYWEIYWTTGRLNYKGLYNMDKREGLWVYHNPFEEFEQTKFYANY
jgi:antitoxin component YwqK of YwqJK toxin-antitoxin module